MGKMWDEKAKDGAVLPWGTVREQFLDAVTLEVAGNVAPSFSALSRSCWVAGVFYFIRTRAYLFFSIMVYYRIWNIVPCALQ